MAEPFDSPVDIAADSNGVSGLAQMVMAVGVALFILLLFNAHALAAWADGLEPGARAARITAAAHGLADRTALRGLDAPRAAIKSGWDRAKARRWRGQRPEQVQGADGVSAQR